MHLRAGFFLPQGSEFALTLLAANVALAGPGEASADTRDATRRAERSQSPDAMPAARSDCSTRNHS
jgi:hypothetical protein